MMARRIVFVALLLGATAMPITRNTRTFGHSLSEGTLSTEELTVHVGAID